MTTPQGIDPTVPPSGPGCAKCTETAGWWFHLRRCAQCGEIGCCDSSPSQHATAHWTVTGHPLMQSYEPGESWFYNFDDQQTYDGPQLQPPDSHPADQPVPGPAHAVPADWPDQLNQ